MDGQTGLITDSKWTDKDAQVVCKEINKNYVGGEVYRYVVIVTFLNEHLIYVNSNDEYDQALRSRSVELSMKKVA